MDLDRTETYIAKRNIETIRFKILRRKPRDTRIGVRYAASHSERSENASHETTETGDFVFVMSSCDCSIGIFFCYFVYIKFE